jgi:hypothetical protein
MVGGCEVRVCSRDDSVVGYSRHTSAGDVWVSGAKGGDMACSSNVLSCANAVQHPLWDGGERLTVSATGAEVPAFAGRTVVAPHDVHLTSPTCPAGRCPAISRRTPFTVTFAGGESTHVGLLLASVRTDPSSGLMLDSVSADCSTTSSPFTFEAPVLAMLGSLDAGYVTYLEFSPANSTTFNAAEYEVTFKALGTEFVVYVDVAD